MSGSEMTEVRQMRGKQVCSEMVIKIRFCGAAWDLIRLGAGQGRYAWMRYSADHGQVIEEADKHGLIKVDESCFGIRIPRGILEQNLLMPTGKGERSEPESLLNRIRDLLGSVIVFPYPEALDFVSLYVFSTWNFDLHPEISYIAITGNPGSGKSEALKAAAQLCFNAFIGSGGDTDAAFCRSIDAIRGTILIDEAQRSASDSGNQLHKILALGNQSAGTLSKMEAQGPKGQQWQLIQLSVFGPKVLASRSVPGEEAILSRTTEILMSPGVSQWDYRDPGWLDAAEKLRNDLLVYRQRRAVDEIEAPGQCFVKEFRGRSDLSPRERQVYRWLVLECPSHEEFQKVLNFILMQRRRVEAIRMNQFEAQVLLATLTLYKRNGGHHQKLLLRGVRDIMETEWGHRIDPKSIAKVLRDNQLEVRHSSHGAQVHASAEIICETLQRLGLSDPEGSGSSSPSSSFPRLDDIPF